MLPISPSSNMLLQVSSKVLHVTHLTFLQYAGKDSYALCGHLMTIVFPPSSYLNDTMSATITIIRKLNNLKNNVMLTILSLHRNSLHVRILLLFGIFPSEYLN